MDQAQQDIQRQNELLEDLNAQQRRRRTDFALDFRIGQPKPATKAEDHQAAAWMMAEISRIVGDLLPARPDFCANPGQFLGETEASLRQSLKSSDGQALARAILLIMQNAAAKGINIGAALSREIADHTER